MPPTNQTADQRTVATYGITVTYGYPVTTNVPPCNDKRRNEIIREERYGEKYD